MVPFLLCILVIFFGGPSAYGQNSETTKIFNEAKIINDDLIDTPLCIKATGNEHGEEYLYSSDFLNEEDIYRKLNFPYITPSVGIYGLIQYPQYWLVKNYWGITNKFKAQYAFFTPPLNEKNNKKVVLVNEYKDHRWRIKPVPLFNGTFFIENYSSRQYLLVKGHYGRHSDPDHWVFNDRRFVFVENFRENYNYDLARLWEIKKVENGTYIIKNHWANEFLYRGQFDLHKVHAISEVDQGIAGHPALTWTNHNLIEEAFLTIEKC